MAPLRAARRNWAPLLVAALALAASFPAGREASRISSEESTSLRVFGSGLDEIRNFLGDLIYLRIDDYHHIWMFQGNDWRSATDYLPMVWLVSRLKPEYAQNYVDGGHHLALNLGLVDEGVEFMQRGLRMCPGDLTLAWEYAVVLWKAEYSTSRTRQLAMWHYMDLVRRQGGDAESPWNEYDGLMVLRELFAEGATRCGAHRISGVYDRLFRNRAGMRRIVTSG